MLLHSTEYTQDSADRALHPVVMLHGMFGAGDNWLGIMRDLGRQRVAWTIDLPGHGGSYDAAAPADGERIFRYASMAQHLAHTIPQIFQQLSPQTPRKCIVFGHSMGGKVAMALALLHPDVLAGLAIIDISPKPYDALRFHGPELAMLAEFDPLTLSSRLGADSVLQKWIPHAPVRAFLIKNLRARDSGGFQWRFDAQAILEHGYEDIADWPPELQPEAGLQWNGPTVFIRGALSPYIDPSQDTEEIRHLFPQAHLATVENANHWVHVDNKDGFLLQLRSFLSKLDGEGK